MKKWIVASSIVVFTLGLYVYFGGLNEVKVVPLESVSFQLQGKLYEGSAKKMGSEFSQVDEYLKAQNSPEKLTAFFYNSPNRKDNYAVKVFIGATYSGGGKLSNDYDVQQFELKNCLQSQHKSHSLISGVYNAAFSYAEENDLKLDSAIAVEQYVAEDSLVLWIPTVD